MGKEISNLSTDLGTRKDVFSVVKAFAETKEAEDLNPEQKRYLADYLRGGKRGGLELSDEKLDQLKTLKKKLSDLGTDFRRCLSEDTSFFWIDEAELDGVPEDVIDSMDVDEEGKRKVTTKYPHYRPVIRLVMKCQYDRGLNINVPFKICKKPKDKTQDGNCLPDEVLGGEYSQD